MEPLKTLLQAAAALTGEAIGEAPHTHEDHDAEQGASGATAISLVVQPERRGVMPMRLQSDVAYFEGTVSSERPETSPEE